MTTDTPASIRAFLTENLQACPEAQHETVTFQGRTFNLYQSFRWSFQYFSVYKSDDSFAVHVHDPDFEKPWRGDRVPMLGMWNSYSDMLDGVSKFYDTVWKAPITQRRGLVETLLQIAQG